MLWVPASKSSHPVTWSFTNTSQTFQLKSLSFCLMYRGRMSFSESLLVTSSILTCLNISLFFPSSWKIRKFRLTIMFYQHFEGINYSALWLLFLVLRNHYQPGCLFFVFPPWLFCSFTTISMNFMNFIYVDCNSLGFLDVRLATAQQFWKTFSHCHYLLSSDSFFFFFFKYLLKYSCFTMLCFGVFLCFFLF